MITDTYKACATHGAISDKPNDFNGLEKSQGFQALKNSAAETPRPSRETTGCPEARCPLPGLPVSRLPAWAARPLPEALAARMEAARKLPGICLLSV